MGIYVGNVKIDVAGVGKVYAGTQLVYQKQITFPYTVQWATGAPVNCTVNPSLPYTSQGGDTLLYINLTTNYDLDTPEYLKFERVYVGTADGGNNIINHTYNNFVFNKANYPDVFTLPMTIPGNAAIFPNMNFYCDIRFSKISLSVIDIAGTATGTSAVTVNFSFADLGIQTLEFLVGRRVYISGYFGKGDNRREAFTNLATNTSTMGQLFFGDAMISAGSATSAVSLINASNNIQFQDGSRFRVFRVQIVRGSKAAISSSFRFTFTINTSSAAGTYWFFPVQIIVE